MSAPVSFCLSLLVNQVEGHEHPFMDASVQVWSEGRHVTTYKLVSLQTFHWPESADINSAENYAVVAARVAARALANVQMEAVENDTLHTVEDMRKMME
jgi:hypothetical protein